MAVCYRHEDRETGVSCANCGRPICPDCMTTTSVGMRCPVCAKQTTTVRHAPSMANSRPVVTITLIAINLLVFLGTASQGAATTSFGESSILRDYSLFGPAIESEPWRLVTSGFLHAGIFHVGFNMYVLWFLGDMIEPALGPVRFIFLYFACLLAGSFGALLFAPDASTVGASGAVFGLMGAAFMMQRARGINPMQSGLGLMIGINLAIGFLLPNISIGGHLGGLIGGTLAGYLIEAIGKRGVARPELASIGVCVAIGVVSVIGAFAVANGPGVNLGVG